MDGQIGLEDGQGIDVFMRGDGELSLNGNGKDDKKRLSEREKHGEEWRRKHKHMEEDIG